MPVVALTALGRSSQLPQHLRASLKAGLTPEQLLSEVVTANARRVVASVASAR